MSLLKRTDLAFYLNKTSQTYKRDCGALEKYHDLGIFSLETLANIDQIKTILNKGKASKRTPNGISDSTMADCLGKISRVLMNAKFEKCGMTAADHEAITKALNIEARRLKGLYERKRKAGEGQVIDDFASVRDRMQTYFATLNRVYDMSDPTPYDIEQLQIGIIGMFTTHFYNVRANFMTLKIFDRADVDWKNDNVFIFDKREPGNASILWNSTKVARIETSKRNAIKARGGIEKKPKENAFLQHLCDPPFEEITDVNPREIAEILIRFITRFRLTGNMIFLDRKGKTYLEDNFRSKIEAAHELAGKKYGIAMIRPSYITHLRKNNLSRAASKFLADQCHHSEEENLDYCRDAKQQKTV
ncbi:hypothetical protein HKX48_008098 [Thoreauomyces humboldtii]|nr:hypothetical protein HKX48_008098 [Thoreauomyces humboldtii]